MKSAAFYKFVSGVLALLLAAGGAYAAKIIHDARLEADHFREQQTAVQAQLDTMRGQLDQFQEILQKLETDPEFLDHLVRARLNYARPDEKVFRFNVDTANGEGTSGNVDSTRPSPNTSLLSTNRPGAPANSTAQRR